jgi:hypothetical protein
MFFPPSISHNPPPVSSENGSLNSSEEDTGGGLHSGLTSSGCAPDPVGSRGSNPVNHGARETDWRLGPLSPSPSIGSLVPFPDLISNH